MIKTITVEGSSPYPIYLGQDILTTATLTNCCSELKKRVVIMTDSHLYPLQGKQLQQDLQARGVDAQLLCFPAGEHHKTRETKAQLEDALLQQQYGRDTCLIAFGGGVVSDLVGFVAATYCRGIPVIYIPTTLLAMVDASIGGKTGVNTPQGKNLIGTFTQPHAVFMDINTLHTLSDHEWRSGMVEMIKHSIIADASLFLKLQKTAPTLKRGHSDLLIEMIYQSCLIKKAIVEQDETEQGQRQLLNFGHTIGHAIEILEQYRLSHGEAVAIGMLVEAYLAVQQGYLSPSVVSAIQDLCLDCGLPLKTSVFNNKAAFLNALVLDKKTLRSVPRFVLLNNIGDPHHENALWSFEVAPNLLDKALDWAATTFGS